MSILNMLLGGVPMEKITEYETGQYSPNSDTSSPAVYFSDTHTKIPDIILFADDTGQTPTSNSRAVWFFAYWKNIFGKRMLTSGTYGSIYGVYGQNTVDNVQFDSAAQYESGTILNYVTNTYFYPKTETTAYARADRTYSWIALWMPSE